MNKAAELLIDEIEDEVADRIKITLYPKLVVSESCGALQKSIP